MVTQPHRCEICTRPSTAPLCSLTCRSAADLVIRSNLRALHTLRRLRVAPESPQVRALVLRNAQLTRCLQDSAPRPTVPRRVASAAQAEGGEV